MKYTKKQNQEFALQLLLSKANGVFHDMRLANEKGEDLISNKKLLEIIKCLEYKFKKSK